jgi:hypothetical protein
MLRESPPELDVVDPLEKAIEEFHKLREDSYRLLERARWPDVKVHVEQTPMPDEAPFPAVPSRRGNAD